MRIEQGEALEFQKNLASLEKIWIPLKLIGLVSEWKANYKNLLWWFRYI